MAENHGGMNEDEARTFHGYWIMGMAVFVGAAIGAHLLAWSWRPWF
jgi:light-harvesting complex 1 beta chain